MVVLRAKEIVNEHDGDGRAGDDHNAVAQEEKAEHVVNLIEPDAVHDEVELDEDSTEGEGANEEHGWNGPEVGRARGNLAGDLVGADGSLDALRDKLAVCY